jgi:uncharacterized membrane protein YeiH
MTLLYVFDLIGTFVFAISGVLISSQNRFDFFGASVIAFVTAIGGGTLRDVLLGYHPISWIENTTYIYVISLAIISSALLKPYILKISKTLFLFDTIGISVFTIIGVQKAYAFGVPPIIAVIMGTITAVFGGVLRDVLCNEQPLIFRKEIYATPCILGGTFFLVLLNFNVSTSLATIITSIFIIGIRLLAVKKNWALPIIK